MVLYYQQITLVIIIIKLNIDNMSATNTYNIDKPKKYHVIIMILSLTIKNEILTSKRYRLSRMPVKLICNIQKMKVRKGKMSLKDFGGRLFIFIYPELDL